MDNAQKLVVRSRSGPLPRVGKVVLLGIILGHESIQTTHGYIDTDLATKEQVLEKVAPAGQQAMRFKAGDELLRFLATF